MGDLTPITREEYYLARMAGEDVTMPEPITREEEYMKGIAAQIEAGSAELPAVTDVDEGKILAVNENGKWDKADAPTELPVVSADDNGDILTVVEGAWAKADAPESGGVYYIDVVGAFDTELDSSVTALDIMSAYNAGKACFVRRKSSAQTPNSSANLLPMITIPDGSGAQFESVIFDYNTSNTNKLTVINARLLPIGKWFVKKATYTLTADS